MSQDYSPSLVTKNLVFCGDAAMKSAAGPATLLYDKVNDNNGTMYNGTCLDLDGSDDYVLVPDGGTYGYSPGNGSWTISMWVNADVFSDNTLLSNTSGSPVTSAFYISTAGKIAFTNYDGAPGWQVHAGDTTLSTGTWYLCTWVNYAGSLSTNATMKMFVNGVADSSEFGSVYTTNGGPVDAIGRITSAYFNGKIADVRFYDVAFSDANVKEIYDDSKVIIPTKNDASGGFVAPTNLKRWWSFAEGAGVLTYDGSGNQADGTMTNMASDDWLTGQTGCPQLVEGYNRKLYFSGDDYVDCGNNSSLNFTTSNFSISCWVYIHDLTDVGYIVRRGGWGSNGWYTYLDSSGRVQIYTNDSGQGDPHTQTQSNSSVITANTWHHVVWVRNGATGVIYVDGTDETASGDSMIDPATSTNTCYIGSATNYISGIVDEVIVYDTVVTSSQAAALHATDANGGPLPPDPMSGASSLPSTSNVVSYWRNDGESTWADRGNNSNDGTPAGTPTTLLFKQGINGSKNVNTGRDNQGFPLRFKNVGAVGFNGVSTTGDYIAVADSPYLDGFTQFSISANLYPPKLAGGGGIIKKWATVGQKSFMLYYESTGKLYLAVSSDGTNTEYQNSVGAITEGAWNDIALTFDAGAFKAYINGVDVGVDADYSTQLSVFAGSDPVNIGYANWADYYLEGQLANVRLYNRALTYAEIQQNYNSFKPRFGK